MTAPDDHPREGDLEAAILGAEPELTAEEVAEAAGVPLDRARALWRALGFPDAGEQRAFTAADATALAHVDALARTRGFDAETALRMTRALGQTLSRLAEWEVALVSNEVESQPVGQRTRRALELVETVGPPFESLLRYAWRRHLAAAAARIQVIGSTDEELHVAQATVGFVDLVAFTALTNELGDAQIGDLVEVFESRAHDVVTERGGRVVKTLGDSVLFVCTEAAPAIDIALDLIRVIGKDDKLPDVRLGLASGGVVLRMGDVYGPPVNLAARLTHVARRNRVIIDQATADLLAPGDFAVRRLPARPVRGFGDLEPLTVSRTRSRHAFG